jgi:hypothetical protein
MIGLSSAYLTPNHVFRLAMAAAHNKLKGALHFAITYGPRRGFPAFSQVLCACDILIWWPASKHMVGDIQK